MSQSNGRNSFPVFFNFGRMMAYMEDENAGKIFKAIVQYADTRKEPSFDDPMLTMVFENFRTTEDDNFAKWLDTREKRVRAGKESGKARGKKKDTEQDEQGEEIAEGMAWSKIDDAEEDLPFN